MKIQLNGLKIMQKNYQRQIRNSQIERAKNAITTKTLNLINVIKMITKDS